MAEMPPSPAIPKGNPLLPPRSAAVPVASVPSQALVRGPVETIRRRVGGTPASIRASLRHILDPAVVFACEQGHDPSHSLACEILPARPMIQIRMLPTHYDRRRA